MKAKCKLGGMASQARTSLPVTDTKYTFKAHFMPSLWSPTWGIPSQPCPKQNTGHHMAFGAFPTKEITNYNYQAAQPNKISMHRSSPLLNNKWHRKLVKVLD